MSEAMKVVVRYVDGTVLKGTTQDFFPNRPSFHLIPFDGGASVEVRSKLLKAVFFVKDFTGNASRRDIPGFIAGPGETGQGKKVAVRFRDGELMCGYSLSYMPDRDGFFLFPADKEGNNLRVYVATAACSEVKAGPAADTLAQRVLDDRAKQ
jgi:hypothetical protein